MRIGQVAREIGVHPQTLRRWEREGRIPTTGRNSLTGQRTYTETQVQQLRLLVMGKKP